MFRDERIIRIDSITPYTRMTASSRRLLDCKATWRTKSIKEGNDLLLLHVLDDLLGLDLNVFNCTSHVESSLG